MSIDVDMLAAKHGLNVQQKRFADLVFEGEEAVTAYKNAGYKGEHRAQWSRMLKKKGIRAYLAERRRQRRDESFVESETLIRDIAAVAYANFSDFGMYSVNGPEDLPNLPHDLQMLVKGWKWDQQGNFTLQFEDRAAAREQLMKYFGLYQADAVNDKDRGAMLVATALWQFVISLHVTKGMRVEEALRMAEGNPQLVETWAKKQGLLPAGDPNASG